MTRLDDTGQQGESVEESSETSPTPLSIEDGSPCTTNQQHQQPFSAKRIAWEIMCIAIPTTASLFVMLSAQTLVILFVSQRLGALQLARFSIGLAAFNVLGASFGVGFTFSLDTLVPHSLGRDPESPEVGVHYQRSFLFNLIFLIPICILFYSAEPLLLFLLGAELGTGAAEFLRAAPPYLFLLWCSWAQNKTFAAMKLANYSLVAAAVGSAVAVGCNYYFLAEGDSIQKPVLFLALSQLAANAVYVVVILLQPNCVLRKAAYPSPHLFDREPLMKHFKLGLGATGQVIAEWWGFELVQVVVAQLGDHSVAVYSILYNILFLSYRIPQGIAVGGNVVIGNALGANDVPLAKFAMRVHFSIAAVGMCSTAVGLYFGGATLFRLYTDDASVLQGAAESLIVFILLHESDSLLGQLQAIYRATGTQHRAIRILVPCLWVLGLPLTYLLGVEKKGGVKWVITAQCISLAPVFPLMLRDILVKFDWPKLALLASRKSVSVPRGRDSNESSPTSVTRISNLDLQVEDPRHVDVEEFIS
jgi:MATE family multidrug resistance protein